MAYDLTTLDDVKLQASIPDASDDPWLASAITSVSSIFEAATRRWLAPRGTMTRLFDAKSCEAGGRALRVPEGLQSVAYLGVSDVDQPDDGSGAYTEVTGGIHLRGVGGDGWPGTRIELDATAVRLFPITGAAWSPYINPLSTGYNAVKVTGAWGWAATPDRVRDLATIAVVRSYRARASGAEDVSVVGPEGGIRVLRRIAPDEMAELLRVYAADTRRRAASLGLG